MKAVIFDVDGTLLDTHAVIVDSMEAAFVAAGLPVPRQSARTAVIGLSLNEAMRRLSGVEGAALGQLEQGYRNAYLARIGEGLDHEPLFPGARDVLDGLRMRDDFLMGVATGKALRGVDRMVKAHGLGGYFVTRQTPDHNPSKPHPGMLLRAMEECGVDNTDMVMVGDTSFDIEMARAAGVRSIGVSWGYHAQAALKAARADIIIDAFADMPAALDELLGAQIA